MIEFDSHDILNRQNNTERNVIDRLFNEKNRQIGEPTELVLALTQQIFSNPREGNVLNTVTANANSRSDRGMSCPNSMREIQKLRKKPILYKLLKAQSVI